jgi:uncharacterized membrane protein
MLSAGLLIALRREWRGLSYAVAAIIIDLTAVNLLVFYLSQWKALIGIAVDYVLLAAVFAYRRIYLEDQSEEASRAEYAADRALERAIIEAAAECGDGVGEAERMKGST